MRIVLYCCIAVALPALLCSCSSSTNLSASNGGVVAYNIELRQQGMDVTDHCNPHVKLRSIQSARKPELIPAGELTEPKFRIYALPCGTSHDENIYDVPITKVLRITETSDALEPPKGVDSLQEPETCCRDRNGLWIFDKLEIRGAIHYRGSQDSIFYASAAGGTTYYSSLFGTGRGGSSFFEGLEFAGLWNASWLDPTHRLQLGVLLGAWPVDGSLFIPIAFHPRYTFKQHPEQYSVNCNSWYLFADVGIPMDFNTGAPFVADVMDHQRYMYGVGVGYDWSWGCNKDFSIDAGFRRVHLPLPQIECCPQVPASERNPFRRSDALFLRVGVTY